MESRDIAKKSVNSVYLHGDLMEIFWINVGWLLAFGILNMSNVEFAFLFN